VPTSVPRNCFPEGENSTGGDFSPTRARLVVAAAIVDQLAVPSRVLAARRVEPCALAGGWEFPGGKVEPGEDPIAALHRELAEELQVRVRLGSELRPATGATWPLASGLRLRLWFAEVTTGTPSLTDSHDELRWLTTDRLDDVPWLPADLAIVDQLRPRLVPPRTA
jgi:8-oxo-dGTP diphosphatase